jgi:hypothetical protein
MTADARLTPATMVLYSALHREREMADLAAMWVAEAWVTTIAVVPVAVPIMIAKDGMMFALFDLGADLDGDVAERAVAVFNPDGWSHVVKP